MFKKHPKNNEEEKIIENSEQKIIRHTPTFDFNINFKPLQENENNINLLEKKLSFTDINISNKSSRNNYGTFKKKILEINSRNILNDEYDDNRTIINKINKKSKYIEEIKVNKNELYNCFVFFQQLLNSQELKNKNEESIKTELYNYIIENKFGTNTKILRRNKDILTKNRTLFHTIDNQNLYTKTFYDYNRKQNTNNIIKKSLSFSYNHNYKSNNYFTNYFCIEDENVKDTPKSVSQIFDEYLLTDNKRKEKTSSKENSKYSNHEYSFDLKNKENNEISFQSIEKEKINDKFFDFNNNIFNENFNSDNKEMELKNNYQIKSEKRFDKEFNKCNLTEELLINSNLKKNERLEMMESNSVREKHEDEDFTKNLLDNSLFRKKITISPSKNYNIPSSYIQRQNFNHKNKESIIESEKTEINEIKVNKSKILHNKEKLINEKINELNEEIKHFKEEREKMSLIKDEYEKLKMKLLDDIKEYNLKKKIHQRYWGNDNERSKIIPQTGSKIFMSITQHNQTLLLNNYKKTEIINLLKKRIYQLENIIKKKNRNCQESNKIHKSIIKRIKENNINIFINKRNDIKKKNNEDYLLKKKKINLKKNVGSNSLEKIKEFTKNDNINPELYKNYNINNNFNKLFLDVRNNKKSINASYTEHCNIKNNIASAKILHLNNILNNTKKYESNSNGNHLKTVESLSKKYNQNINKIQGNKIKSMISKRNDKIEHTNLHIYEKLIKHENEREKENKFKRIKLNINSVRDFREHKKIMKKLKTEFTNNNEKYKENKRTIINSHFNELKNELNNHQKNKRKNIISKRLGLNIDGNKNKSNSNILRLNKVRSKNYKAKEFISQERNNNNRNIDLENNYNIKGYDFIIPEKYKLKNKGKLINTINSDGKIINIYEDNMKEIIFKSGVKKQIFPDGYQLINFPNGDKKQKFIGEDEKVIYFYNDTNTIQTTFKNGINIFKFNNGQIEKHYPDGSKYIYYTNGLRRKISKNGTEEIFDSENIHASKEKINKNKTLDAT